MPPLPGASKRKQKERDARRSRSRNTTPSSVISAGTAPPPPSRTPYLELDTAKLLVPSYPQYSDILDTLEAKPSTLEPKQLQGIIDQLKKLGDGTDVRVEACERALRLIHEQKRDVEFEYEERERQAEQDKRTKARKEVASTKTAKAKKRKDRGGETVDGVEIKNEDEPPKLQLGRSAGTPGPVDSPSPSKKAKLSPGTSSLSEVADSPDVKSPASRKSPVTDVSMSDVEEENKVVKRPPVPQQGFFPDPLAPDPIVYHIREITPGMSDAEKKNIYNVTEYPTVDLSDQIAGQPPDKDFSNAKPTNQVAANTFLTFAEPYLRPLTEEDIAFLRERGDRTTPFLAVPRGKKTYQEIWEEEDGMMIDRPTERLPPNQPRGSVEQINDDNLTNDQISTGPLASRLLSLLKFEHRSPPSESSNKENEPASFLTNGNDDLMDLDLDLNGTGSGEKPLPPATAVSGDLKGNSQRLDYVQSDERIKAELRHLGLLGLEENPDYDAHHDDDISERLRLLQGELRRVMVTNGARKARLLDLAKERLAHQEYSTIHEDLDGQVQQAYLKRTRTLGKTKKGGSGANKPRPGHIAAAMGAGFGPRARDIGESARMLMNRRERWEQCIGPVFKDMKTGVPSSDSTLWDSNTMQMYEKAELETFEEDGE